MRNKKNDEPSDEFDHIVIPEFLARPFERLSNRPLPPAPAGRPEGRPGSTPGEQHSPDSTEGTDAAASDDEQPAPRAWWAGYRGKLLLYGAGTVVMVFLQSRS